PGDQADEGRPRAPPAIEEAPLHGQGPAPGEAGIGMIPPIVTVGVTQPNARWGLKRPGARSRSKFCLASAAADDSPPLWCLLPALQGWVAALLPGAAALAAGPPRLSQAPEPYQHAYQSLLPYCGLWKQGRTHRPHPCRAGRSFPP